MTRPAIPNREDFTSYHSRLLTTVDEKKRQLYIIENSVPELLVNDEDLNCSAGM